MRAPDFQVGNYLRRWWLIPRNRWANAYLHRFDDSDGPDPHDHPWWNVSIILRGRYREHYHDGTYRDRRAGCIVVRHPNVLHRLQVINGPVWTLFITGPRRRVWGFMTPDGWIRWDRYAGQRDEGVL